jgi:hypothetical protein
VGILRLRGTGVTDAGLAHLAGRKWLTHLDLGGTRVTDRGLAHLKGHKALVLLGLNATATTDAGLANFANCEGLSELDLGGTRTTDAGLALFADCKGLKLLNVQRTQVTAKGLAGFHAAVPGCRIAHDGGGIEPKAADPDRAAAEWVLSVGGRATVQTAAGAQSNVAVAKDLPAGPLTVVAVDLKGRGAAVTDAGLVRLRELAGVTHVKLGGTGVTDAGLAHLAGKAGLKLLDLERTGVTDAGLAHLRSMTALRSLSLGRTGVTDAGLECLAGLKALGALNLGHTGTTGAGLAHLKPLTALYELSLYGTALADRDAGRLAELTSLVRLSVTDTPLTRDAVRQVAAALPGCRVEWGGGVIEPADADRAAAGLVIAVLGTVRVDGAATDIATAADLPRGRFALTAANLSGREAWEEVVAALGRCGRLATIDLDGTTIADARLAHLHGLEALARLSVRRTKVTAKGLEALHAAVPGCRVEHDGGVIEPKK